MKKRALFNESKLSELEGGKYDSEFGHYVVLVGMSKKSIFEYVMIS